MPMPMAPPSTEQEERAAHAQTAAALSPGEQLRQAREQAGMSLQEVSERTLISLFKLQALERDDYTTVGGTAHITGYTRAYARVIGLDAKALVSSVESALNAERDTATAAHAALTANTGKSGLPRYLPVAAAALTVLIGLWLGLWWFGDDETSAAEMAGKKAQGAAAKESRAPVPEPQAELAQDVATDVTPEEDVATDIGSYSVDNASPATARSVDMDESLASAEGMDGGPNTLATARQEEPPAAESMDAEGLRGQTESQSASLTRDAQDFNSPPLNVGEQESAGILFDELRIVFVADCWLEVTDATGRKLVADLAQAGSTRQIDGVAPFNVLFGNANAASEIILNQQAVPFSPRPGKRVTRITVGE